MRYRYIRFWRGRKDDELRRKALKKRGGRLGMKMGVFNFFKALLLAGANG